MGESLHREERKMCVRKAEGTTKEDPENNITIDSLLHKNLEEIIQNLPLPERLRAAQVCRKWRDASRHAWKDIEVLKIVNQPGYRDSYLLFRECRSLRDCVVIEDNTLHIATDDLTIIDLLVSRVGEHIKRFIFDKPKEETSGAIVQIIAQYCQNIEFMKLKIIHGSCAEEIRELLEVNQQCNAILCKGSLEIIKILPLRDWKALEIFSPCYIRSEEEIIALIRNAKSLEDFGINHWSPNITRAIVECKHLKNINFQSCNCADMESTYDTYMLNRLTSWKFTFESGDAIFFSNLLKECFNLKNLWLYHYEPQFPDVIKDTVLSLPQLENLTIGGEYLPDGFFVPFTKYKHLTILVNDYMMVDDQIFGIVDNLGHLESLDLDDSNFNVDLFEDLITETRERQKILKVRVPVLFHEEVSKMCEGSNVQIVRDFGFFSEWY